MKLIERLYVAYYRFSLYNREHHVRAYIHPRFDSIFYLSFLTIFNISSILKLMKVKPLITTHLFDCFLILIILVSFLVYRFEKDSKYIEIVEKYNSPSELRKIEILGWVYTILTLVFFFWTHMEILY